MLDPVALFSEWFTQAQSTAAIREPTAMTLATATADGVPSARVVLLKAFDARGFVFYTNYNSRKGRELAENPRASLCFYWMPLDKQVRVDGRIERVSEAEADAYYNSRERGKQIGAWASLQSQHLHERAVLEARVRELEQQYEGRPVPRPPHWSGFRVVPETMEFWQQRGARLHERDLFTRDGAGWKHSFLYP